MAWQEVINFLGGATLFSLLIGYIGKAAIEAYVNGRVESYKSDLQRITTEHSITFQHLHNERAEVIKNIYRNIAQLDEGLASTLKFLQGPGELSLEDKVKNLVKYYSELRDYYIPNKIFLATEVCEKIDVIIDQARDIFINVTTYPINTKDIMYDYDRAILGERHSFWEQARKTHDKEFTQVKSSLEIEFRKIIGVAT
jgi:hypothetical protein